MDNFKPKQLIVEGAEDLFVVVGLMEHYITWPRGAREAPVHIEQGNGADEILRTGYITTKLKESGLQTLGIMLDADESFDGRVRRIYSLCRPIFPAIPEAFPKQGLIVDGDDGLRFGVWIMPDNSSHGMLESFLRGFVPTSSTPLFAHAESTVAAAMEMGCPCHRAHIDKAHIHTWLAWQNPPGERLGLALTRSILNPKSPSAEPFVNWFRELYRI